MSAPGGMKRPSQLQNLGPSKRTKFDGRHATKLAPDEEAYDPLEEDIGIGAARKKDIKLDGYASDSSEEGHGVKRAPNLDNETGPMDDADDDMFGEAPSKQADHTAKDADERKTEKFMELKDIQGQDFSTQSEFMDIVDEGEDDEEENDDDSVDEEVGALGRKTNAPKLDSFNMRAELEEGQFDTDGNYIRTAKDQKDNQDNWLKDVSRKDIAAAREAVERRAREDSELAARQVVEDRLTVPDLLAQLVPELDAGETLLECLSRLGTRSGRQTITRRTKHNKKENMPEAATADPEAADTKATIQRLTEIANRIMAKSTLEIYDTEREGLLRYYKRETGNDLDVNAQAAADSQAIVPDERDWEFVWAGAEDQIHGPYDSATMKDWLADGLLRSEDSVALVRRAGEISFVEATPSLF